MTPKKRVELAQKYLQELGVDGWLLYDFHRTNDLASEFLLIPEEKMATRRLFYWIPAVGEPVQIVHVIEPDILNSWPGKKSLYFSWKSLEAALKKILSKKKRVAMEYSEMGRVPYLSKVDAGTVDLIRSLGVEVVSSGSFLPHFTAVLDGAQVKSHKRAAKFLNEIVENTWKWVETSLDRREKITEYKVQQKILLDFKKRGLITTAPPIVAVNAHSADPHFEPSKNGSSPISKGDFLLIDLWAKEKGKRAVFADITRVKVVGGSPSPKQKKIFEIVKKAQKAAIDLVKKRFSQKKEVLGSEVDNRARKVIVDAGYGDYFIHRTGHSIEIHLHGSGANIDNFETQETRPILKGTCFSIEPGIYLPKEFGIRLETDLYVDLKGEVFVTGQIQETLS